MGEHKVKKKLEKQSRISLIKYLLDDIQALELMLEKGLIEDDIIRVGAEQEFCLVNSNWRPADNAVAILENIDDPHFTTELAKFNLEINLDPFKLEGNCFAKIEEQLRSLLEKARAEAAKTDTKVILTGILPSIGTHELSLDYMTPKPRYYALNDMLKKRKGENFLVQISGVHDLSIIHDSVMFEACNTSFQTHLQIKPDDFMSSFNWAQAISGPVLSVCVNSPLLLGRELWQETRIALFQQSIDTRSSSLALKDQQGRVGFGDAWATGSIADFFKNEVSHYKILLSRELESSALDELEHGIIPKLRALNLHNGTIYKWNRPCYGVGNGKAHVRIECRYIPSGPTIIDEIANFAFWVGLMRGRPAEYDNLPELMDFREAKSNFMKAARSGTEVLFNWFGKAYTAKDLILQELLPLSRAGLESMNIDRADIDRLLGVIEGRINGKTGSRWMINGYRRILKELKQDDALRALTKSLHTNQQEGQPVHEWHELNKPPVINQAARKVGHIMSTQLFTADKNDPALLTTKVMEWKNIHHVPVMDNRDNLRGLLTWTHMKLFLGQDKSKDFDLLVSDIMIKDVLTAKTSTLIEDAIATMKKNEIGCLPVVHDKQLVGIITIKDVLPFDHS